MEEAAHNHAEHSVSKPMAVVVDAGHSHKHNVHDSKSGTTEACEEGRLVKSEEDNEVGSLAGVTAWERMIVFASTHVHWPVVLGSFLGADGSIAGEPLFECL